jgi:hypothetical protein
MRTLIVAALVLAPPAIGADFRGTELGTTCAAVEEREKALGSQQVPVSATGSGSSAYRFKGRAFDRDVWITYLCKDGSLALGDYHFPEGKYDDAVVDYLAAYNFFLSLYGAPFITDARHDAHLTPDAVPAVGAAKRDEYNASWRAPDIYIALTLMARGDYAEDKWLAFMAVRTPPSEK